MKENIYLLPNNSKESKGKSGKGLRPRLCLEPHGSYALSKASDVEPDFPSLGPSLHNTDRGWRLGAELNHLGRLPAYDDDRRLSSCGGGWRVGEGADLSLCSWRLAVWFVVHREERERGRLGAKLEMKEKWESAIQLAQPEVYVGTVRS